MQAQRGTAKTVARSALCSGQCGSADLVSVVSELRLEDCEDSRCDVDFDNKWLDGAATYGRRSKTSQNAYLAQGGVNSSNFPCLNCTNERSLTKKCCGASPLSIVMLGTTLPFQSFMPSSVSTRRSRVMSPPSALIFFIASVNT